MQRLEDSSIVIIQTLTRSWAIYLVLDQTEHGLIVIMEALILPLQMY